VSIVGRKREADPARRLLGGARRGGATLLGHPAVAEAAVVGVAHAELGEEVAAFVTCARALPRRPTS